MKSSPALMLVIFLVCSFGQNLRNDYDVLIQVDSTAFGNALLSTVALQIKSGGPIENVQNLLSSLQTDLENQQKDADDLNKTQQAACDENQATFRDNIAEDKRVIAENVKTLKDTTVLLAEAEAKKLQAEADLKDAKKQRVDGIAQRAKEHAEYVVHMKDHDEALGAVDEAEALIVTLRSGAFVQKSQIYAMKTNFEQKMKNKKYMSLYTPVIMALAELATKEPNQDLVNQILGLLNRLKVAIQKSKDQDQETEDEQAAAWKTELENLNTEIENLTNQIAHLASEITTFKQIIAEAKEMLRKTRIDLAKQEALLAAEIAKCNAWSLKYKTETETRSEETALVKKIIVHFNEKVASMAKYLKDRVSKF